MVFGGMLVVMLVTWFLYGKCGNATPLTSGRSHFVGPIRALTLWTTGQDIDLQNLDSTRRDGQAIRNIVDQKTGRGTPSADSGNGTATARVPLKDEPAATNGDESQGFSAIPESGIFPQSSSERLSQFPDAETLAPRASRRLRIQRSTDAEVNPHTEVPARAPPISTPRPWDNVQSPSTPYTAVTMETAQEEAHESKP